MSDYQIQSRWLRWLPLVIVAAEALFIGLIFNVTQFGPFPRAKAFLALPWLIGQEASAAEYITQLRAKVMWQVSCFALCSIYVAVVVTIACVIRKCVPAGRLAAWALVGGALLIVVAVITAVYVRSGQGGYFAAEIVLQKIDHGAAVRRFIDTFNILVLGASPFLLAIGAVAVLQVEPCLPGESTRRLEERMHELNTLLYFGAGLLVAGVLEVWAFYSWPAAYLPATEAEEFFKLGSTMSSAAGALYSLLLISIYLPAAFVLRRNLPAAPSTSEGGAVEWLAPLARFTAMIAPLLAGLPLADALKGLAK